jgi:hypothetical protein
MTDASLADPLPRDPVSDGAVLAGRTWPLDTACLILLAIEVVGSLLMWLPIPLAWMWVGAEVYRVTHGSLAADMGLSFCGFVASTCLAMKTLGHVDQMWIALRQRAGYRQKDGALTRVVVVSATFGIVLFALWFNFFGGIRHGHFLIPFMPTQ